MSSGEYAFLIYSSSKNFYGLDCYEYGFASNTFSIVGDKPFSRGDIVQILDHKRESRNEYRFNVKVLGNPRVNSVPKFNSSTRIEIPTLMFLSSRIYLSEFSDYRVIRTINARVISFEGVEQDCNKIYAVAVLVTDAEAHIIAQEVNSKTKFEWVIADCSVPNRRQWW
jgi:hypothetical protein